MTGRYAQALLRLAWLLDSMETQIASASESFALSKAELRNIAGSRRATSDEIAASLAALSELGAVRSLGTDWIFDAREFARSSEYRRGVRDGIEAVPGLGTGDGVRLLAALPPTLDEELRERLPGGLGDLRSAVVNLIASAEKRIVLASPFWDEETVDELFGLLSRRAAAGVRIDLLGRAVGGPSSSGIALKSLADHLDPDLTKAVSWFRSASKDRFGSETFHFKVAIADGARAYLGTANFTSPSLRSRMELGIVASGGLASTLEKLVDLVLGL